MGRLTRTPRAHLPAVLTVAGSDSGGGAGIQADLQTFAALGVFGTSAITCVTAQNPQEVSGVYPLPPAAVAEQIRAVLRGFPIAAAKTGMLYSAPIIRAVAAALRALRGAPLVVDPVMVATSGARLLRQDAVRTLLDELLPLATVVTPNVPEAECLAGMSIRSARQAATAARLIAERHGTACVVKGGHLPGRDVVDVLFTGGRWYAFHGARVVGRPTHGTGCCFSAALAAALARGMELPAAVRTARDFVTAALQQAVRVGRHRPLRFGPRR